MSKTIEANFFPAAEIDPTKARETAQSRTRDIIPPGVAMSETDGEKVATQIQSDPIFRES